MINDFYWMNRALELAKLGAGKVSPNPLVGAVIVKNNQVIGEGYHAYYGGPHAEIAALENCSEDPKGSTLYVTLEPCCHYGKTPPCTKAILEAGITSVVVGIKDPNPLVAGKGIGILRTEGVIVREGILESSCHKLNEVFFHFIKTKKPYVILKSAMSLDGKIATRTGQSKWITGETARAHGHATRGRVKAILVGIGTVLADDPLLTCRSLGKDPMLGNDPILGKNPIRLVLDKHLQIPLEAQLVKTAKEIPLWVICAETAEKRDKQIKLEEMGVVLISQPLQKDGRLDLNLLMDELAQRHIDSLLIEGGASISDAALRAQIVAEINFYIAPIIIGGEGAKAAIGGLGFETLASAANIKDIQLEAIGENWLIKGRVSCSPEL